MPHPEPASGHPGVHTEFTHRIRRSRSAQVLAAAGQEWVPDLSEYNGVVDMGAIKAAGAAGVILRAGFGTAREDRRFQQNRANADAVGLAWMAYWFGYPGYNTAVAEAAMLNATVGPLPKGRGLALDAENDPGALPWPTGQAGRNWAATFLTDAGPVDYAPLWYSSPSFVGVHGLASLIPTWKWWEAEYGVATPDELGLAPVLWQETDVASVAGVSGRCDLSIMLRGSFASLLYGGGPPVPQERPTMRVVTADPASIPAGYVDPHGPGAQYVTTGTEKRYIGSGGESAALLKLARQTEPEPFDQSALDRMPELDSVGVPGSSHFDPGAWKAELDAAKAELDTLHVAAGGSVDLTPVIGRLDALAARVDAESRHLGVGTP